MKGIEHLRRGSAQVVVVCVHFPQAREHGFEARRFGGGDAADVGELARRECLSGTTGCARITGWLEWFAQRADLLSDTESDRVALRRGDVRIEYLDYDWALNDSRAQ